MAGPVLKLGLAGLGFASTLTLPDMMRHPGFAITAAADPRAVARTSFEATFGGRAYDDVEALCASDDVDIVYVSTPPTLHAEHVVMAAAAGKHILVEKPMALSIEDCDRMIAAADAAGVCLIYGHTHCYDPPIRAMRRLAESGNYGAVRMVHNATYNDLLYRSRAAWELDTRRGGGVIFNQAPHQIDIVRTLIGASVDSVHARAFILDPERPTEGAFTAQLSFRGGVAASLVFNGHGRFDVAALHYWVGEDGFPRAPDTHARTHAARVGLDEEAVREGRRFGPAALVEDEPPHQPFFGLTVATLDRADIRQSPNGLLVYDHTGTHEIEIALRPSGREIMLDEVHRSVTRGEPAPHDGRWGRQTVAAALAILASSAQGDVARIRPFAEA